MADQQRADDLAQLRARLAAQEAELAAQRGELARLTRRRRLPRRFAPLALVALFVALLPLSLLAAGPFQDLNAGSPHNGNIQAIADAGITRGCDPPTYVQYCPSGLVTREEMASFLARTAGLGGNPPVANALTAVSATTATTATTAADAAQLGGRPPAAYLPATGDLTIRYGFGPALTPTGPLVAARDASALTLLATSAGYSGFIDLPLDRPVGMFGTGLAVASVEVCYSTVGGARITATKVGNQAFGQVYDDNTTRPASAAPACYTVAPATPQVFDQVLAILLKVSLPATSDRLFLRSATLVLTPVPAR